MSEQLEKEKTVVDVTWKILNKLDSLRGESSGKAALANLRHSIGRPISDTIKVWPILFEAMPESYLGRYIDQTYEEKAILTTLQLYALHQQGVEKSVLGKYDEKGWNNIGESLKVLRMVEDPKAVDRRFNTMITSTDFEELSHHLRQMIQLLRSKHKGETVNYPKLANDLYWFLNNNDESIRLSWAKAYYSPIKKETDTNIKVEEGE